MNDMINGLRSKIATNQFEFTRHALDQSILRGTAVQELREAMESGQVIEDYPQDKYGPSCLVFGMTKSDRPIHIQCSYPAREIVKIIHFINLTLSNGLTIKNGEKNDYHLPKRNLRA